MLYHAYRRVNNLIFDMQEFPNLLFITVVHCILALGIPIVERNLQKHIQFQDNVGDTPLHDAIRKTQKEITELLINARNIDLELNNKRGFNPLHHAALSDNPQ